MMLRGIAACGSAAAAALVVVLLAAAGCCAAGDEMVDASTLGCTAGDGSIDGFCEALQAEATSSSPAVHLLQTRAAKQRRFPDIAGILSKGFDSASDGFGGVIGNGVGRLEDQVGRITGGMADSAATTVAAALNGTVDAIDDTANSFADVCDDQTHQLRQEMQGMRSAGSNLWKQLAALRVQLRTSLVKIEPVWEHLTGSIIAASSVAKTALQTVGQGDLGEALNASVGRAVLSAGSVTDSLRNASSTLAEGANSSHPENVRGHLRHAREVLVRGLDRVDLFAHHVSAAFGNLTHEAADSLSSTLPGADKDAIQTMFHGVELAVDEVTRKVAAAPRSLITGFTEALENTEQSAQEEAEEPQQRNSATQRSCIAAGAAAA